MFSRSSALLVSCFCSVIFNSCAIQFLRMLQDVSLMNNLPTRAPTWIFHLSRIKCVAKCLDKRDCSVMVYNTVSLVCNLYDQSRMATSSSLILSQSGWTYYHQNQRLCLSINGYIYDSTLDRCIKIGLVKTTHSSAVTACQSDNAMLVRIDSHEMWQFVSTHIGNNNLVDTYIQGTKDAGGTWRFDDGSAIPFLQWGAGQPGNTPTEIYLDIWKNDAYRYHDVSGLNQYH